MSVLELARKVYSTQKARRNGHVAAPSLSHRGYERNEVNEESRGVLTPAAVGGYERNEVNEESPPGRGRLAPLLSSASPEWYTPLEVLEAVRDCLGDIELDPCSNSRTEPNVPAARHYTAEDDGLAQDWTARTAFVNPPYGRAIGAWVEKLLAEYAAGRLAEAIALVPARTDTAWFRPLFAYPVCYVHGRLKFSGSPNAAPFPSALVYLGPNPERFRQAVARLGSVAEPGAAPQGGPPEPTPYQLVAAEGDLPAVLMALDESVRVGLDLETTGLNPRRDRIRLLSLATDRGVYLVDCFRVSPAPLFEALAERDVIAHNALFDLSFLSRRGFVPGVVHDTMLLSRTIHGTRGTAHKLQDCVERELGRTLDKAEQRSDWSGTLTPEQLVYAATDVQVLPLLYDALTAQVEASGLTAVAEVERRCLPAVVWLARSGVGFDREAWERLAAEADAEAHRLAQQLDALAPAPTGDRRGMFTGWNWDSPQQVQEAFAAAGVTLEDTTDETLARTDHPLAELLRDYRVARKRCTAFGKDWLKHVAEDGRVYASWNQLGADSGRFSCSTPNLQQFPRGVYRRCVVAPAGRVLVKADYSQIELRLAAKITGDRAMQDAYLAGADLHTLTAQRILGKQDVAKEDRQLAKAVNFGLLYGMAARGFQAYARSEYGLRLTELQAIKYRQAFFAAYPGLTAWHNRVKREHASETRTLLGRRRLLDKDTSDTLRLNTPVQGSGADGLKAALALLWERREQAPGAFPVLAVHDEIVMECDAGQAEAVAAWLRQAMVDAMAPMLDPVPVEVEVKTAPTWGGE